MFSNVTTDARVAPATSRMRCVSVSDVAQISPLSPAITPRLFAIVCPPRKLRPDVLRHPPFADASRDEIFANPGPTGSVTVAVTSTRSPFWALVSTQMV